MADKSTSMTAGSHARALLALGLPLIGSYIAQMALHVTDTVLLGWYGIEELAAVSLAGSAFFVVFVLGSGFSQAIMPMVAASMGRGDEAQVRRDARMGLWLSILFGALTYPVFWWAEPILLALGQEAAVARLGQDFLRIAGLGMIPALAVAALRGWLSSLGHARIVLWATLLAVAVNLGLAWPLIFGRWGLPELGVQGAAIASLVVQVTSALTLGVYATAQRDLRRFHLFQRFLRPDWPAFVQVFRMGWPIGLTGIAESGMFAGAGLMMGWIGTVELAAHGIAMQVTSITFMVHLGLSNAATVQTGHFHGAGARADLRLGAKVVIVLSAVMVALITATFLLFPVPILSLFTDRSKPEAVAILTYGSTLLAMAALFQLADAMQVIALGLLRGLQETRWPMIAAATSYWLIGLPLAYVLAFPMGWGGVGLWFGLVVGLTAAATSLMLRFWHRAA